MNIKADFLTHPRRVTALCATMATSFGLVSLSLGGAPFRYLWMNAAALVLGLLLMAAISLVTRPVPGGVVTAVLASLLLAATLFGATIDGATRWVAVGGVYLQPSFLLLPLMVAGFARTRDALSAGAMVVAALALAVQPDRAMAGALAIAMMALVAVRGERTAVVAFAAAVAGFVATMVRPDDLPPVAHVEHVLAGAFGAGPVAALLAMTGVAVLIVPALVGWRYDRENRAVHAAFGALWLGIVAASVAGNYPTPMVGYGGSAIIGYVLAVLGMPRAVPAVGEAKRQGAARCERSDRLRMSVA